MDFYIIDQRLAKAKNEPRITTIQENNLSHFAEVCKFRVFKTIAATQNGSEKRLVAYLGVRK